MHNIQIQNNGYLYNNHHISVLLARISLTLAMNPYRPSFSAGLPCYILYQYRAVVDRSLLVALLLLVGVKRSTRVRHL